MDGNPSSSITDYTLDAKGSLLLTTVSVFFAGTIGGRDSLFLFGDADQSHEFALTLTSAGTRPISSRLRFTNLSSSSTTWRKFTSNRSRYAGVLLNW